jgi:glycolate oxidase iron-sulfur subunit
VQTKLAPQHNTPDGQAAAELIRSCVHCGFCTATCPTYQLLGDERDGPRGRIYLIKQVLEGEAVTASTQLHLDRCLTCRACETACPSGVQYAKLLDIGRKVVEQEQRRGFTERLLRRALAAWLTGPLFGLSWRVGQGLRPVLPLRLRKMISPTRSAGSAPSSTHTRRMLLLAGCVQPAMQPSINTATHRILDAVGVRVIVASKAGCCGAIRQHLGQQSAALDDMRRNIDAWWPQIELGVEAIVVNASGCGAMVRDYGHLLRDDPQYAAKAARVSALTRDPIELLSELRLPDAMNGLALRKVRVAFHAPCSLQHGLKIVGAVERLLRSAGAELVHVVNSDRCCGSAGTYSLLQPAIAGDLREQKLAALEHADPEVILSANIGCIQHLGAGAARPVLHWIEWLDSRISGSAQ